MNSFKKAAIQILEKAQKPLHYREITQRALDQGILMSDGKTPWATMMARISTDIKESGKESPFLRTEPGQFALKKDVIVTPEVIRLSVKINPPKITTTKGTINKFLSSKQKGDLAEARVAELITLYGNEGLSCYKPISDDEGIDIIVKKRGVLDVVYVQVKSSYGFVNGRGFVSTVKEKTIVNKQRMLLVFVFFDLSDGDLYEYVFCIPAPDFLKLTRNEKKQAGERVFTVGLSKPEKSKYSEFMIEKRELANKINEIMSKL